MKILKKQASGPILLVLIKKECNLMFLFLILISICLYTELPLLTSIKCYSRFENLCQSRKRKNVLVIAQYQVQYCKYFASFSYFATSDSNTGDFFCENCKIFKITYFEEHLRMTASMTYFTSIQTSEIIAKCEKRIKCLAILHETNMQ